MVHEDNTKQTIYLGVIFYVTIISCCLGEALHQQTHIMVKSVQY